MDRYNLATLVDMAKTQGMRPRQRRRVERWERSLEAMNEKAAIYDELETALCGCHVAEVASEARLAFAMQSDCEADVVEFGIDPDNVAAWLEVIADFFINKLPKILEVLMPWILRLLIVLLICSPAIAEAGHALPLWVPPVETAEMTKQEAEYAVRCSGELLPLETAEQPMPPGLETTATPAHVLAQLGDCAEGQCSLPVWASTAPPEDCQNGQCLPPVQASAAAVSVAASCGSIRTPMRPLRNIVGGTLQAVRVVAANKPLRRAVANFRTRRAARIVRRVGSRW